MAYTRINFKTKKAFKEAVAESLPRDHGVQAYQPGPFGPDLADGDHAFEGPHYPQPHRWYATGTVKDGKVTKVK